MHKYFFSAQRVLYRSHVGMGAINNFLHEKKPIHHFLKALKDFLSMYLQNTRYIHIVPTMHQHISFEILMRFLDLIVITQSALNRGK